MKKENKNIKESNISDSIKKSMKEYEIFLKQCILKKDTINK